VKARLPGDPFLEILSLKVILGNVNDACKVSDRYFQKLFERNCPKQYHQKLLGHWVDAYNFLDHCVEETYRVRTPKGPTQKF
jgi:hypothetical protein